MCEGCAFVLSGLSPESTKKLNLCDLRVSNESSTLEDEWAVKNGNDAMLSVRRILGW